MASSSSPKSGCFAGELAEVEIDSDGCFKYILVRMQSGGSGQSGGQGGSPARIASPSRGCGSPSRGGGGSPSRGGECRDIVRGSASAELHNQLYEKICAEIEKMGCMCKCLGGGKIDHNSKDKKIHVSGNSQAYGKADHSMTVAILKKAFKDYDISCSDD
ncbi:14 kDa phosphohistidine phosphatase-like [Lacerta agilis]|uniref:14 kDa phosphohistidine phosphatase-like n=1 Tax=Lacerta agilis TaxID=80427 RepID=UPI001419E511|nr:14 kDa phosphohistidine phosphatase-like [Lacerta agilis]